MSHIQFFRVLLSLSLLSISYLAIVLEIGSGPGLFWMLTVCFFISIAFEYTQSKYLFFSLPPTYFSFYMLLNIFVSGLVYYFFSRQDITEFYVNDTYVLMGAWYTLASIQSLWVGFYILKDRPYKSFSSLSIPTFPLWVIHILVAIFAISFVIGVNNDMFGYVADSEKNDWLGPVRQGISLGLMAVLALTIYHYDTKRGRLYLYTIIFANMFVGLMFGSKSTVMAPIIIFILANYLMGRRVGVGSIAVFFGGVVFAYSIVEPFRIYFDAIGAAGTEFTVGTLVSFFFAAKGATEGLETQYLADFVVRMNYATMLGNVIEFGEQTQTYLTEQWEHLALSPLYGLIPRFIWEGKPLADFGLWASVEIFNLPVDTKTHIGITPQGFAYLVFRLPGIVMFFLIYGIIDRISFNSFYRVKNLLPIYIYFYFFILYPSYPTWTAISSYIQALIVFIPVLLLAGIFRQMSFRRINN
ncbi:hypothetical protein OAK61_01705 [Gammaproteobacteria bacterium]|nr:hypothetical protein [Gammaproteobacteria bacterium]